MRLWKSGRIKPLASKEIIDEFPFFSYLLADLHPHLLVMPFAMLALSLALNVFLDHKQTRINKLQWQINYRSLSWSAFLAIPAGLGLLNVGLTSLNVKLVSLALLCMVFAGFMFVFLHKMVMQHGLQLLIRQDIGRIPFELRLFIKPLNFWLAAIVLGGIAFLNTWDFPFFHDNIYIIAICLS